MITANTRNLPGGIELTLQYPGQKQPVILTVENEGQGQRLVYFHTRRLIIEKLTGWLKQRMYAVQQGERRVVTAEAAKLLVMLNYYSSSSLSGLCRLITDNKAAIESVAPGPQSRFYNNYQLVIAPIITFCQNFKEEQHGN